MPFAETISTIRAALVSWFRQNTTTDALKDGAKTFGWVALLTILIWIYAEQRQRVPEPDVPVRIALHSSDTDRIVTFVRPHDEVPIIAMEGPKQTIDDVKRQLAGDKNILPIDVPSDWRPGVHDINIEPILRDAPIFTKNGIKVTDVSPKHIDVRVERLNNYDLPVVAPPTANLDGPATFEPKTVRIRAPEDLFNENANRLGGADKVVAVAQLTGDLLRPGPKTDVKVPVQLPFEGDNVSLLSSPTVQASYQIKQSNVPMDIPSLLISTLFFGTVSNEYSVELSRSTVPLTIIGPPDKCRKVIENSNTNQEPKPYAYVTIGPEDVKDLRNGARDFVTIPKRLSYQLGDPDVMPAADQNNKTVDVTIRRRAQ